MMRSFVQLAGVAAMAAILGAAVVYGADGNKAAEKKPAGGADDVELAIRRKAADYAANVLTISDEDPPKNLSRDQQRKWPQLTPADAEAIAANCPAVAHVSPVLPYCFRVTCRGDSWEGTAGVSPEYLAINELKIAQGAAFSEANVRSVAKVCILAPETAKRLFGRESAVGKTVSLERYDREDDPAPLRVVGVLAAKGPGLEDMPRSMENLVPWTLTDPTFRGRRRPAVLLLAAKAAGRGKVAEATSQISRLLRKRRGVVPGQPDGFCINCNNTWIDERVALAVGFQRAFPHGAADFEKAMKSAGTLSLFGDSRSDAKVSLEGVRSAKAFLARGRARLQTGKFDDAVADFSEAIRLEPKSVDAWAARGMAYCDRGDFDKAVADFSEVLRLAPKTFKARIARGTAYGKKGDHDQAIADFTAAIAVDPNYALAYGYRAVDYYRNGDLDHALADINEAIRRDGKDAALFCNRGMMHVAQGHFDQAIADCSEALWLNPIDAQAYHWRSVAYSKRGEKAKAATDAAWAGRLGEKPEGGFSPSPRRPEALAKVHFLAIAQQGSALIKAMNDYRNAHGLWPQRVEDFAEKYLGRKDIGPWSYEWTSGRKRLFLRHWISRGHGAVSDRQRRRTLGTELRRRPGEPARRRTESRGVEARPAATDRGDDRRVSHADRPRAEAGRAPHRADRLLDPPQSACRGGEGVRRNGRPLAQGNLAGHNASPSPRASRRRQSGLGPSEGLCGREPRFAEPCSALVNFYRSLGRNSDALAAIRESLKLPEITAPMADDHAEWWLSGLAGYAYEQKQYDLVLGIAQAWDDIDREVGSDDRSFHALRAAAFLAQGNFGEAQKHYRRAARYAQRAGHGPLAGNLDALKKAIEARNRQFVYGGLGEPRCAERAAEYY